MSWKLSISQCMHKSSRKSITCIDIQLSKDRKKLVMPQLEDDFRIKAVNLSDSNGVATLSSDGLKIIFSPDEVTMSCVESLKCEIRATQCGERKSGGRSGASNIKALPTPRALVTVGQTRGKTPTLIGSGSGKTKSRGTRMLHALDDSKGDSTKQREVRSPQDRIPDVSASEHVTKSSQEGNYSAKRTALQSSPPTSKTSKAQDMLKSLEKYIASPAHGLIQRKTSSFAHISTDKSRNNPVVGQNTSQGRKKQSTMAAAFSGDGVGGDARYQSPNRSLAHESPCAGNHLDGTRTPPVIGNKRPLIAHPVPYGGNTGVGTPDTWGVKASGDGATVAAKKLKYSESYLGRLLVKTDIGSLDNRLRLSNSVSGVRNLGNTCFISAICQALFSMDGLVASLLSPFWSDVRSILQGYPYPHHHQLEQPIPSCFLELWKLAYSSTRSKQCTLSVGPLKSAVTQRTGKYAGYSQHDAHEFLGDLLVTLHEDMIDTLKLLTQDSPYEFSANGPVVIAADTSSPSSLTNDGCCDEYCGSRDAIKPPIGTTPSMAQAHEISRRAAGTLTAKQKAHVDIGLLDCRQDGVDESTKSANTIIYPDGACGTSSMISIDKLGGNWRKVLLPTVRTLQSVVEVTLKCTSCGHERSKQEDYNDFSLLLTSTHKRLTASTPQSTSVLSPTHSSQPHMANEMPPSSPHNNHTNSITQRDICTGDGGWVHGTSTPPTSTATAGTGGQSAVTSSSRGTLSLETLLDNFFAVDRRDLSCEKCNHSEAQVEVFTAIQELPNVLVIQLKRFEYDPSIQDFDKIRTPVVYPARLNMSRFLTKSAAISTATNTSSNLHSPASTCILSHEALGGTFSHMFPDVSLPLDYAANTSPPVDIIDVDVCVNDADGVVCTSHDDNAMDTIPHCPIQIDTSVCNDTDGDNHDDGDDDDGNLSNSGGNKKKPHPSSLRTPTRAATTPGLRHPVSGPVMGPGGCSDSGFVNTATVGLYETYRSCIGLESAENVSSRRFYSGGRRNDAAGDNFGKNREGDLEEDYVTLSPIRSNIFNSEEDMDNDAPKGRKALLRTSPNSTVAAIDLSEDDDNWTCGACTFYNNPLMTVCEMCENTRASGPFSCSKMGEVTAVRSADQATVPVPCSTAKIDTLLESSRGSAPNTTVAASPPLNKHNITDDATDSAPKANSVGILPAGVEISAETRIEETNTALYELVSVVRHVGRVASAGHYTCDARRKPPQNKARKCATNETATAKGEDKSSGRGVQKTWRRCDDAYVYDVTEEAVLADQSTPYILVYERIAS